MHSPEPRNPATSTLPRVSAPTPPFVRPSLWLRIALTSIACLLSAEWLAALVYDPLLGAVDEVLARETAESKPGPFLARGSAAAHSIEPQVVPVVCEQVGERGVPPAPRSAAGWLR
jgi:hypothetical protein